ncbi:MAG: SpoIIE family protein phosphatase [Armatimonadetes bacterium]|nr:SpoIIE family protein phosphatase [Armatimonadota bacterium]
MKILIADDDAVPRRLLEATLSRWGYEIVVAKDGQEAWDILEGEESPKMAILDWMMPEMDGLEVCRKVRQREQEDQTPYVYIIMLTSKMRKEDVIEGMEAGADDYLTKPFNQNELQVRMMAGQRILDLQAVLFQSLTRHKRAEEELARARKREVGIGAKIQQTLLLGQPPRDLSGIQVSALTIPSQQIDGDFYDFFQHGDQVLDVVVGDVMGKGVPAALLGAAIKSHLLRALGHLIESAPPDAPTRLPEPEAIVAGVHKAVTGQFIGLDTFETLCYFRIDLDGRQVKFVDCGHTATIHYRHRHGNCRLLQGDNMPLGFSEREVYTQVVLPFEPGDIFVFYSDGVTEAQNEAGEFFGVNRLEDLIRANGHLAPDALTDLIHREVVEFSGADTFADDLTCVAVKMALVAADAATDAAAPAPEAAPSDRLVARAELEVASDLGQLAAIWEFIRAFGRQLAEADPDNPWLDQEDRLFHLELAANEVASNIIKHAYEGQPDRPIQIVAEAYDDRLGIYLYHEGVPFDPEAVAPPSFDGSREGGFGVFIVQQSVDEVNYTRDEQGRNCVSLVLRRQEELEEE